MPSISVHGASVFYRRHPAREAGEAGNVPLLLVHGAGGTLTHWPPHLRRLPGRTVMRLICPATASRPAPPGVHSGVRHVAGRAAGCAAHRSRGAGRSLHGRRHRVGCGPALPGAGGGAGAAGHRAHVARPPALLDGLRSDFAATTARIARLAYARTVADELVAAYAAQLQTVDPALLIADFQACNAFDVRGQLAAVTAPTLILVGTEDRMTPPALSRALHAGLPDSTLTILDGAGHMLMLEQEAAVMAELDTFLKTHSHG
ncbi:MAG: alpha/beta hydrolase [Caldilineaceae bacterium]